MATPKQRKEFYELYGPIVEEQIKGTGLYPQVILAQLALESAYGTSKSAKGNLGGRKLPQSRISSSKKGVDYEIKKTSEHFSTKEEADAFAKQQKNLGYKVYGDSQKEGNKFVVRLDQPFEISGDGSPESNVQAQIDFFLKNPRYEDVFNATSPKEQAELIKKAGYATAPNYASAIESIYNQKDFYPYTTDSNDRLASQGIDPTLDPTAQALGLPTSEDVQKQLQAYNDIKAYEELAASDPSIVLPLPNPNYNPDRSISEQYLEFNPELAEYFQGADNIPSPPSTDRSTEAQAAGRASDYEVMSAQDLQNIYQGLLEADAAAAAAGVPPALVSGEFEPGPQAPQFLARRMQGSNGSTSSYSNTPLTPEEIEKAKSMMSGERTPSTQTEIDYKKEFDNYETPKDSVDRNFLSKLKGQDYTGLLSDIGAYAARMGPLMRAMREADSYDQVRYPRFSPALPTAYAQKSDIDTAFNTARQAAMQQGKLDLGTLSALATQQAKETARVEENVANERVGLLNQAQQLNNQVTMQEMADTAANKGAAATMKYQALAAMSEMGQGSLREANMRRNDQIVKQMFASVFDELDDIKGSIG